MTQKPVSLYHIDTFQTSIPSVLLPWLPKVGKEQGHQRSKLSTYCKVTILTDLHDKLNHSLQVLCIGTKGASFVRKENHELSALGIESSPRLCHRSKRKPGCVFHLPGLWNLPLPVSEGCCCTSEVNKSKGCKYPSFVKKGPSPHLWGLSEVQVQHAKFKSIPYCHQLKE